MHLSVAEAQLHPGKLEEFKRLFPAGVPLMSRYGGMNLYGAWETVIGPRHLIIDVWQSETPPQGTPKLAQVPEWQQWLAGVEPTISWENLTRIAPLPYCRQFNRLKTRAILYWKMRTARDRFKDWVEVRSRFKPMAEERGWVLAAAWSAGWESGSLHECTEVWFFEDQARLLELMARVEQDKEVQKVLSQAGALLLEDSSRLMRPTWYSPDYLP